MQFTNFLGQSAPTPTAPTPASNVGQVANPNVPTQYWNGQQIPANVPTKNLVSYDAKTGNKTFSLPVPAGQGKGMTTGGVYTVDKNNNPITTTRNDNGLGLGPAQSGQERDHMIPVSLGGASQPGNGQMIPSATAGPQDKAETAMAKQVKSGQIDPHAAISDILRQKESVLANTPSESITHNFLNNLFTFDPKTVGDIFSKQNVKSTANAYVADLKDHQPQSFEELNQDIKSGKINVFAGPLGEGGKFGPAPTEAAAGEGEGEGALKGMSKTPEVVDNTPEMRNAQIKLDAAQKAHLEATNNLNEANSNLENLNQKAQSAQAETPKAQAKLTEAQQARQAATQPAVSGVDTINERVAANKTQLGKDFQAGSEKIEQANPNAKLELSQKQIDTLNALKENKNFTLPDKLDSEKNFLPDSGSGKFGNIKLSGKALEEFNTAQNSGKVSLSPTEAQDLIKQLNRSTFKQMPDGSFQVDQQRIGITNEIKDAASKAYGPQWDDIYSKYSQGRAAIEKIDNLVNLDPKANPADLNKQLKGIQDLAKTPEGKLRLQQSIDEYNQANGVDLNDPVKAITQIIDKDMAVEEANGNLSATQKQEIEAVKAKLAAAKNAEEAQQILEKAQRDAEIQRNNMQATTRDQLAAQKKANSFSGKYPTAVKWGNYAARVALIGSLLRLTVYPAISKLTAKPKAAPKSRNTVK